MALMKCPECGKSISDKAHFCPHCGYPMEDEIEEAEPPEDDTEEREPADDDKTWEVGVSDGKPTWFDAAMNRRLGRPSPSSRADSGKKNNVMAQVGFILGIASIFLYEIGILPILGIVFSAIGLGTFDRNTQKNRWMAGVGLGLSVAYTFAYLYAYGHLA